MATRTLWNIKGQEWLNSLEDMEAFAEEEPDNAEIQLTQFEKNLLNDLRRMVQKESNAPQIQNMDVALTTPKKDLLKEAYQKLAFQFFEELDHRDWSIDDDPDVSIGEDGAYVQMWSFFRKEEIDD